jgi:hypothetical protein
MAPSFSKEEGLEEGLHVKYVGAASAVTLVQKVICAANVAAHCLIEGLANSSKSKPERASRRVYRTPGRF